MKKIAKAMLSSAILLSSLSMVGCNSTGQTKDEEGNIVEELDWNNTFESYVHVWIVGEINDKSILFEAKRYMFMANGVGGYYGLKFETIDSKILELDSRFAIFEEKPDSYLYDAEYQNNKIIEVEK